MTQTAKQEQNEITEDMVEATITCDNCRRQGSLEKFNGNNTFRVPPNWICVKPQITRGRQDDNSLLKQMTAAELNEKIAKMVPMVHICEECLVDKVAMEQRRIRKIDAIERKKREKEQAIIDKQNKAVVEVTRVTSGRRLMIDNEVRSGN